MDRSCWIGWGGGPHHARGTAVVTGSHHLEHTRIATIKTVFMFMRDGQGSGGKKVLARYEIKHTLSSTIARKVRVCYFLKNRRRYDVADKEAGRFSRKASHEMIVLQKALYHGASLFSGFSRRPN